MLAIGRFATGAPGNRAEETCTITQLDDTLNCWHNARVGRDAGDINRTIENSVKAAHTTYYRAGDESCIVIIRILHTAAWIQICTFKDV